MSSNFANSWQKHTPYTSQFYMFVLYLVKTRKLYLHKYQLFQTNFTTAQPQYPIQFHRRLYSGTSHFCNQIAAPECVPFAVVEARLRGRLDIFRWHYYNKSQFWR